LRNSIARNAFWSLLGTALPLLAAVATIPPLIGQLGVDRFGILTLAWVIVGYFSLFDLGLSRGLTALIAERLGGSREGEIPDLVVTALWLIVALGIVGAAFMWCIAPWLVSGPLAIPDHFAQESAISIRILALSIPVVIIATGLRAVLEAFQRFALVAALQAPVGVLTFVAPLIAVSYHHSLPGIMVALAAVRVVSLVSFIAACKRSHISVFLAGSLNISSAAQLARFGGWMTVSAVVGPLLLYLGRFVIAVQLSVAALTYFVTPYEVVTRLLVIPATVAGVLFPAFANRAFIAPETIRGLYQRCLGAITGTMLAISAVVFLFAERGLEFWINADFAIQSHRVAQILAVGVLINSVGYISQALIQALGRPDWTAKLHVVELIIYVPYLVWLTAAHGILGAATAWTVRVTISTVALLYLARKILRRNRSAAVQAEAT
jgi:O-antigen/teichoic acid export membrane protein